MLVHLPLPSAYIKGDKMEKREKMENVEVMYKSPSSICEEKRRIICIDYL